MRKTIKLKESELKHIIAESVKKLLKESDLDLNRYVPKKAFKMVEKVNNELRELKNIQSQLLILQLMNCYRFLNIRSLS